jgi:ABC-type multidrug transport system permease subunit
VLVYYLPVSSCEHSRTRDENQKLIDRFAWTAVPVTIHWIVPIIATVLFGAAIVGLFLGILVSLIRS